MTTARCYYEVFIISVIASRQLNTEAIVNYKVNFRYTKENPQDEKFFASYIVDATSVEMASSIGAELLAKDYPDLEPEKYDLDVEWPV